ncbi:hypothetical protein [Actinophytocola sp.]|uniref:hypothetical protein n=1 Tax=Actinophytocola sp. TaxID=1872138 RepID=UPI0025C44851|nr:hypothetical protein [Actinophytocola sp.]
MVTKIGVDTVLKAGFRQRVTPDRPLGRMTATFRFLLTGALALGWVPVACPPLRTMRELPA